MSPTYAAIGNYFTTSVDIRVASPSGPLAIVRQYDSALPTNGVAGAGWSSTVGMRLYYASHLVSLPSTFQKRAYVPLEDGTRLAFTENGGGTTYTPLHGRFDSLVKNGDGSWDLTLQHSRRRLHFSSTGALTARYDESGNVQTFTYDGTGKLQQIADGAGSGRYLNIYHGGDGRVSDVEDNAGRSIHYTYNPDGTLDTFEDAEGRVTSYGYVNNGVGTVLASVTDHWGRTTTSITYDLFARVQTLTANGETDSFIYNDPSDPPNSTQKHPAGTDFRWWFAYDANGMITDRTRVYSPLTGHSGPTAHTDYYADSRVQMMTDERGVKTYYTYDATGRVATVTRDYQGPTAIRFDYAYDPAFPDRVTSVTPRNPSSGTTRLPGTSRPTGTGTTSTTRRARTR
jgi:YD repeat-containing protein